MVCARSKQYRAFRCSVVFRLVGLVLATGNGCPVPSGAACLFLFSGAVHL